MTARLVHIVLFEVVEGVTDEKTAEVTDLFLGCDGAIPGVTSVSVSHNFSESAYAANWTYSALVELESETVLETFLQHPHHKKISAATSDGFAKQIVVFDHKVGSEPGQPSGPYDMRS